MATSTNTNKTISDYTMDWESIDDMVPKLEERKHLWNNSVRKARSPRVTVTINGSEPCQATIDEGAEFIVID